MLRDINESLQRLMGDFVMDSMSNMQNAGTSDFTLSSSDDFNIAHFQEQVGMFLLRGKKFLLCDIADSSSIAGQVSAAIKQQIHEGVKSCLL